MVGSAWMTNRATHGGMISKNEEDVLMYKRLPRISKGYRYVYAPDAYGASKSGSFKGYILEHRYVMEKAIGRALTKDEDVHHIDLNPLNNAIDNLKLMSKKEHYRLHYAMKIERLSRIKKTNVHMRSIEDFICKCGKRKDPYAEMCIDCWNKEKSKHIPSKEDLASLLEDESYESIGKKFGVSGNAVRKWKRKYGIVSIDRRRLPHKTRKKQERSHRHGTSTMYKEGCRCEVCVMMHKRMNDRYYKENRDKILSKRKTKRMQKSLIL